MRQVVIIGAAGQLGRALVSALEGHPRLAALPLTREDVDLEDHGGVRAKLEALRPWAVINTAAFLRVDDCEDQVEEALRVNATAAGALARACRAVDAILMHVSTDYVFGADAARATPYGEDDLPGPVGLYGISKLAGEHMVEAYAPRHFVVRSAGLYNTRGSKGKGGNFVETMLRVAAQKKPLRVVDDQRLTPTYTPDLAAAMLALLETERFGRYHVTNGGDCSWFEFAAEIFRQAQVEADLGPTTTAAFGAKAARPPYSVLSNAKLAAAGVSPPRHWREALAAYLAARGEG